MGIFFSPLPQNFFKPLTLTRNLRRPKRKVRNKIIRRPWRMLPSLHMHAKIIITLNWESEKPQRVLQLANHVVLNAREIKDTCHVQSHQDVSVYAQHAKYVPKITCSVTVSASNSLTTMHYMPKTNSNALAVRKRNKLVLMEFITVDLVLLVFVVNA